jgi:hypothetical protein
MQGCADDPHIGGWVKEAWLTQVSSKCGTRSPGAHPLHWRLLVRLMNRKCAISTITLSSGWQLLTQVALSIGRGVFRNSASFEKRDSATLGFPRRPCSESRTLSAQRGRVAESQVETCAARCRTSPARNGGRVRRTRPAARRGACERTDPGFLASRRGCARPGTLRAPVESACRAGPRG